tara:strand:- start:5863 stop:6084 length:222 start_codon:yes stop_codon:yes gene_type:complete
MGECTIKYDRSKCIGATNCVNIAPDTWELDSDGLAKAKITKIPEADKEKNIKAAKSCPTHAIEIIDSDGKKLV